MVVKAVQISTHKTTLTGASHTMVFHQPRTAISYRSYFRMAASGALVGLAVGTIQRRSAVGRIKSA